MDKIYCIVDGAAGIYVPQEFAESTDPRVWHVDPADHAVLAKGPPFGAADASEDYWDVWESILDSAYMSDGRHKWMLYQDGDLFAVRDDFEWEEA
jgi:hypothetical protein